MSLPAGFRARVRADVRVLDAGRTLLGGNPMRLLRIRPPANPIAVGEAVEVRDELSAQVVQRLLRAGLADPIPVAPCAADELTVVVPVRDRADGLDRLLNGLRDSSIRLIVVDDASSDAASIAEVAERHNATLLRLEQNVGPGEARNAGIACVTTPFVAFVDSDVVVSPDVLRGLAGHFEDPAVAAVAPRVRPLTQVSAGRSQRWETYASSLDMGPDAADVRPLSPVGWLPTACLIVRVAALSLDEGPFAPGRRVAEDVDLVWRLLEAGHVVRYDPSFVARHEVRGTAREWLTRKAFYGTGGAWLAHRHRRWVAPAVFTPVTAAAAGSLVAQRRWSVPIAAACGFEAWRRLRATLPRGPGTRRIAMHVTWNAAWSTARQVSQLALRHWWPAVCMLAPGSRRVRRVIVASLVIDLLDHKAEFGRKGDPGQAGSATEAFVVRRLDDLAYGTGLWTGAIRARSVRALVPELHLARATRGFSRTRSVD